MLSDLGAYDLLPDPPLPVDTFGGHSMIVEHRGLRGLVVTRHDYGAGSSYRGGAINLRGSTVGCPRSTDAKAPDIATINVHERLTFFFPHDA